MKDPKRIDKILKLIEKIWRKQPELRLGQLIGGCIFPYKEDFYYIEDNDIEHRLKTVYKEE